MKVSFNWLKDYVDIKVSPRILADRLTMAGLEVTSLEEQHDDVTFEIEVTSNRPDCLSVLGIAQEVAAVLGKKLKIKKIKPKYQVKRDNKLSLKSNFIKIKDKKGCVFYRGCLITGVKVGPSPVWIRKRLESVGVRCVNNIVDITNYFLLVYGQPLHAFDYDKITEQIVVRRAKNREKILTIDGVERELDENILVISDKNRSIAIAGVIGDKLSEVGILSRNILLESAYFDPICVRRASRQLGLITESSYRFERQVDFQRVSQAQDEALDLICELSGGRVVARQECGVKLKQKTQQVRFDCKKANEELSLDISRDKIKKIFAELGFSCRNLAKDLLSVSIPALRRDIKKQEDLVEEFARIYGYSNIPSTIPSIRSRPIENSEAENIKLSVRELLCASGFDEVITYSLLNREVLGAVGEAQEALRLDNPLSREQEYLRPTLIANLLKCLSYNLNRKNKELKFFEIGHIFGSDFSEDMSVALIATGKLIDNWQVKKEFDFFSLKGVVKNFLNRLGIADVCFLSYDGKVSFLKQGVASIVCQGKELGVLGGIDNQTLLEFGIKNAPCVFYAEISLVKLCECVTKHKRFQSLSIYPSLSRDLSLVTKKSLHYAEIVDLIKNESGTYLKDMKLVDMYKGEQIPKGSVGLTISLEFGSRDRTLTDKELDSIYERIVKRLKHDLVVEIR